MPLHQFTKKLKENVVKGDESTNEEYKYHQGSFSIYFRNKQIKLDTQAKCTYEQKSQIFQNCVIYINGYTNPSAQELKQLIVENGGQVCAFFAGKSYATHIVANSLTSRKVELFKNMKVVKPNWISDSVKMGRLLSWTLYRTITIGNNHLFSTRSSIVNNSPPMETHESLDLDSNTGENGVSGAIDYSEVSENTPHSNVGIPRDLEIGLDSKEYYPDSSLLDMPGPQGDAARVQWIIDQRTKVNTMDRSFISDYFAKSRLHYLSTRKLELRNMCRKYISPLNKPNVPQRVLMHVDFDSFFVAVALKSRTHLTEKPVCVSYGSNGSDIASCNYVARQRGVFNGQWVASARMACPDLICLPYEFEEYTRCSDILYNTLIKLLPYKITAISVDEAIIDITNLAAKRSVTEICEFVRSKIRDETGIEVSIGVGKNILMAKMALKQAKPAGQCINLDAAVFRNTSVKDLPGVGRHIGSKLDTLGVKKVEQLLKVSLDKLQQTVGISLGQRLYSYAMGADSDDISTLDVPVRSLGIEIGWGVRIINEMEKMEFVNRCAQELWHKLERSAQVNEVLTVKVYAKSPDTPFLPPKYMGHGLCEVKSRSSRIGPVDFTDLLSAIQTMVRKLECEPLDFRGLGLHMKVNDPVTDPGFHQSRIIFGVGSKAPLKPPNGINTGVTTNGPTSTSPFKSEKRREIITPSKTTPVKRSKVSLPVQKRRRTGMTLTQMVAPSIPPLEEVDIEVLAELPSQIRREILLNEDDYVVPQDFKDSHKSWLFSEPPLYKKSQFMGISNTSELRLVLKQWIDTSKTPLANDAQEFYDFICESARDNSSWVSTIELCEWFRTQINRSHPLHDSDNNVNDEKWHELSALVDSKLQQIIADRL